MQTKHLNDLFPCENCNKMFKSFNGLLKHQRSHNYLKQECDDCDYRGQFSSQLAHHQKKTYKGPTCTMSGSQLQKRIQGQVFNEVTYEDTYKVFAM